LAERPAARQQRQFRRAHCRLRPRRRLYVAPLLLFQVLLMAPGDHVLSATPHRDPGPVPLVTGRLAGAHAGGRGLGPRPAPERSGHQLVLVTAVPSAPVLLVVAAARG